MLKMPASVASAHLNAAGRITKLHCRKARCIDTPVAPIGCPFAFSPPDGLTGSLPSFCVMPSAIAARALPLRHKAHRFVFDQLCDG